MPQFPQTLPVMASRSARVSDPAALGAGLRPRRNLARRGSPNPAETALGAGLRPRRNRRPKVSRDLGDLRSAGWLGQETGHSAVGRVARSGDRPQRGRPGGSVRRPATARSAGWLGQRPATARSAGWLGQETGHSAVGRVARSETGHTAVGRVARSGDRPQRAVGRATRESTGCRDLDQQRCQAAKI
jgi:hypothetical protein